MLDDSAALERHYYRRLESTAYNPAAPRAMREREEALRCFHINLYWVPAQAARGREAGSKLAAVDEGSRQPAANFL